MTIVRGLMCCALPIVFGACALGPDYSRPSMELPEQYQTPLVHGESIANIAWWNFFKDERLQDLIRVALAENQDIRIAAARIDAARALFGITRAEQFPRIDAAGEAQRFDASDEVFAFSRKPLNNFGVFGDLSFELDIWGKLRRASEAQRALLLASEYGHRAVTISLISQVATTYFRILGIEERLAISKQTYENRQGATGLLNARFQKGMIPELDVNQAQVEEADAAVAIANYERELRINEHSLAVLLGRPPFPIIRGATIDKQLIESAMPTGFPAVLLERRPDVLAAEEETRAAVSQIGVAKAEQLPSFDLLGFVGLQSRDIADLLHSDAFTWSIGGNMLGPLLDWGQAAYGVDLAEAQALGLLERYKQTVFRAVQEVEDAVVLIRTYKQEHEQRKLQVAAARNAARLSRARYDDGVTSYLEVLDIERSLFEADLGASTSFENYFSAIVQLYKALGGGWEAA